MADKISGDILNCWMAKVAVAAVHLNNSHDVCAEIAQGLSVTGRLLLFFKQNTLDTQSNSAVTHAINHNHLQSIDNSIEKIFDQLDRIRHQPCCYYSSY